MIIKEIINIQDDRVSNALKPLVCIMNLINNTSRMIGNITIKSSAKDIGMRPDIKETI